MIPKIRGELDYESQEDKSYAFTHILSAAGSSYFNNTFISREEKEFDAFDETISDSRGE